MPTWGNSVGNVVLSGVFKTISNLVNKSFDLTCKIQMINRSKKYSICRQGHILILDVLFHNMHEYFYL
jgi:hypothetical protein